jgi:bacteriocin-like protein
MHDVSCVNEGAIRELTVDELAAVSGGAMMCALMWFGDHLETKL